MKDALVTRPLMLDRLDLLADFAFQYGSKLRPTTVIQTLSANELKVPTPHHSDWAIGGDPATRPVFATHSMERCIVETYNRVPPIASSR